MKRSGNDGERDGESDGWALAKSRTDHGNSNGVHPHLGRLERHAHGEHDKNTIGQTREEPRERDPCDRQSRPQSEGFDDPKDDANHLSTLVLIEISERLLAPRSQLLDFDFSHELGTLGSDAMI
jgi:hypothetical protein